MAVHKCQRSSELGVGLSEEVRGFVNRRLQKKPEAADAKFTRWLGALGLEP